MSAIEDRLSKSASAPVNPPQFATIVSRSRRIARRRRAAKLAGGVATLAVVVGVGVGWGILREDTTEGTVTTSDDREPQSSDAEADPVDTPPTLEADDEAEGLSPEPSADSPVRTVVLSTLAGTPVDGVLSAADIVTRAATPSLIGDLQWTVLAVEAPLSGGLVRFPAGFASVGDDGALLISDDALTWRAVASPFPGSLDRIRVNDGDGDGDGQFAMRTLAGDGSVSEWRSSDFVTWKRSQGVTSAEASDLEAWIDGSVLLETGLQTESQTPEGNTLVHGDFVIDWNSLWQQVGGDDLEQRLADGAIIGANSWDPSTEIVELTLWSSQDDRNAAQAQWPNGPDSEPSGIRIGVATTGTIDDWRIDLEDLAEGEVLGSVTGSLPGVRPEADLGEFEGLSLAAATEAFHDVTLEDTVAQLATRRGITAFFLSSEDGLERVDHPPWRLGLSGGAPYFVLADDDLYAYFDSGQWRSPDGRTWQVLDGPPVPTSHRIVEGPAGVLLAWDYWGNAEVPFLRSENGTDWVPPSRPPIVDPVNESGTVGQIVATGSGWLLLTPQPELALWTSADGDIWELVNTADLLSPSRWEEPASMPDIFGLSLSAGGNVVLAKAHHTADLPGRAGIWIIEVQER